MPRGSALVVALASRVVMTIGDLFWAGVAVSVGRKQRRAVLEADETPGTGETLGTGGAPEVGGAAEAAEVAGAAGVVATDEAPTP
jgi:hypothetical protein